MHPNITEITQSLNGISYTLRTPHNTPPNTSPTLIFLHYWGGTSRTWTPLISHLPPHFPTLTIDHRGWGNSLKPSEPYPFYQLADDVDTIVKHLDLQQFVLIGHSMGAKIAQYLATRDGFKERIVKMILVAPAPSGPVQMPDEARLGMLNAYGSREAVEFTLRNVLTHAPLPRSTFETAIEDSLKGSVGAVKAWVLEGMVVDFSDKVGKISVPTLVLAGEFDKVEKVDVVRREVVQRIPGAEMVVIREVEHLMILEDAEWIARAVAAYLS